MTDAALGEAPLTPADRSRSFLSCWRRVQQDPGGLRPLRVGLAATFTIEPLLPYLGCFLAQRGLHARFLVAPYGQLYPALLDPAGTLGEEPDVLVGLPRLEDLCGRALRALDSLEPGAVEEARAACRGEVDQLLRACQAAAGKVLLLMGTLPTPAHTPLGVLDAGHPASRAQLLRELNHRLCAGLRQGARPFDLDGVVCSFGAARAHDERLWYLSRCPFSDEFLRVLGLALSRAIVPLFVAPAKVIVLDLDNTLWGGIVGEDGPAALALGDSGLGAAFVAFQEALLRLRDQGVLLCVASKNNEADAFEVIDGHPEMRLRRQHLSAWRISWQDKPSALREIAQELALPVDSFVFIDDNPAEREQVRRALPQVTVLELPEDPARYVAALRALPALDRMVITAEDQRRADLYAAERARRAAAAAVPAGALSPQDLRGYLESLALRVTLRPPGPDDVPRVAQLTQKTNQFNLTTRRRSEAEIAQLLSDPAARLHVCEVSDRFGDYGLVGVAIARRDAADAATWELDTLLLSCRVLGRGVETGVLRVLVEDLARSGARRLRGRFLPTTKNAPAAGFLPGHGFRDQGDGRFLLEPLDPERYDTSLLGLTRGAPRSKVE